MIKIVNATTHEQLDEVRRMMQAFLAWHRERHRQDLALIEQYFDAAAFAEELASLPGKYAPPSGRLLLAFYDNRPAGCVALRQLDEHACEMKRMFVYPELRGHGVGRALVERIIDAAKASGYTLMRLDTSFRQVEALKLYRSLGFEVIAPYYPLPPQLKDWLIFMELAFG